MKKDLSGIPAKVLPVIDQAISDLGCFIWDIEFVKEGAERVLRITIDNDTEEGITIDNCVDVHHAVDALLDEADPIETSYTLQITSPGLERDITMPWHVNACSGEKVEIRLFAPQNGKKTYTGILGGMDEEDNILLNIDESTLKFGFDTVSKMHIVFDYE